MDKNKQTHTHPWQAVVGRKQNQAHPMLGRCVGRSNKARRTLLVKTKHKNYETQTHPHCVKLLNQMSITPTWVFFSSQDKHTHPCGVYVVTQTTPPLWWLLNSTAGNKQPSLWCFGRA